MLTFRWIACAAVAVFGVACKDGGPTGESLCRTSVAISVGLGTQPTVNWQPVCAATSVTVGPTATGGVPIPLWEVTAPLNGVGPPLRVGANPPGAQVFGSGANLSPGSSYTVYVAHGSRGDAAAGVDSLTFVAQP